MAYRDAKRRGHGWLPSLADIGWSNRLGWYEGFQVLMAVNPVGVITGWGFGAASTKDQPLAETCLAARHCPHPALPSVGAPAEGLYLADTGFEGQTCHQHWRQDLWSGRHLCSQEQLPPPLASPLAALAGGLAPARRNGQWLPASHLPPRPRASPCPRWLPSPPGR